jgi:hypothetical protein
LCCIDVARGIISLSLKVSFTRYDPPATSHALDRNGPKVHRNCGLIWAMATMLHQYIYTHLDRSCSYIQNDRSGHLPHATFNKSKHFIFIKKNLFRSKSKTRTNISDACMTNSTVREPDESPRDISDDATLILIRTMFQSQLYANTVLHK